MLPEATPILSPALLMAAEGASAVVVAGRRQEPIDAVAAEITALGAKSLAVQCDVGDQASVQAMFAMVKDTFGRLDVLFNNAGLASLGTYLKIFHLRTGRVWSTQT